MDKIEQLKALSKGFTIGDRVYTFDKMPFKVGRKVLAFMTIVADEVESGQLGFIDTPKYENDIEPLLIKYTQVNGFNLSTLENHFDDHPSDYCQFVMSALQGFSAPFMPESNMSSHSTSKSQQVTTLKKPM